MKLQKLIDTILYNNGFSTRNSWVSSGLTLVTFSGENLIYSDKNKDTWSANTGTTSPVPVDYYTTGITITTVPYLAGTSAYTYQMVVTNNRGYNVASECSYISQNTAVATVNSTGLISAVYTGSTAVVVKHPDMLASVTSNTFTVKQVVSSMYFENYANATITGITMITGTTVSGVSMWDQANNRIDLHNVVLNYTGLNSLTGTTEYVSNSKGAITFVAGTATGTTTATATYAYGTGPTKTIQITVTR